MVHVLILTKTNSKYTFPRKSNRVNKGRPINMNMASDRYIIDILGPYIADRKNNDPDILNMHLSKKEK